MIYFTSDLHMWHSNIIKYSSRPYETVEQMNEDFIMKWNSVIKPEDTIYCLGDFSFSGRSIELYSHRLNGIKKLIPGNHDPIHTYNKHQKKKTKQGFPNYWKEFYEKYGWEVLPLTYELKVPELGSIVLSHMPYDCTDSRYTQFIPKDEGKYLLHGHTHAIEQIRGKQVHVGVDAWNYTPVSLEQIIQLIKINET